MSTQRLLLGAALIASAPVAFSALPSPSAIVIQGDLALAGVRTDVAAVCPRVAPELNAALQDAWHHVHEEGTLDVRFTLDGQQVRDVHSSGGPRAYARFVRAAVRGLDCQSDSAQAQPFQLRISFVAR